jgi:ketosteroid isomerase-like protein
VSEENVEVIRRLWEAVDRRDREAVFAFYDPDIVWQNHTGGALELQDVSYRGHEAVRQFWRDWLEPFESFEAHAEEFIDAGNKVIVPWRAAARGKASGAAVEMHRSNVYSISNGRVNRVDVFETKAEALTAAGLPA